MTLSTLQFNEFGSNSKKQWLDCANDQLKTEDAGNKLLWELIPGMHLPAYFDQSVVQDIDYLSTYFSRQKFDWQLFKTIDVRDAKSANQEALKALNQGCSGVLFNCTGEVNFSDLTNSILFKHCLVSFFVQDKYLAAYNLFMSSNSVNGFCHSTNGLFLSSITSISEIAEQLVKYSKNTDLTSVVIKVGNNFFFEIARLRAFRFLIDRMSDTLKTQNHSFWIHSEIEASDIENQNLLEQSSAGLAAVIGGANSVSFNTKDGDARIATNVGNLIRDEAKITSFQDASSGSYFIDYLTDQLIQKVWSQFQNKRA